MPARSTGSARSTTARPSPTSTKRKSSASTPSRPASPTRSGTRHKINFIDTPGMANFLADARAALRVADAAIVVVDAVSGVQVQTEKTWQAAEELGLPRLVVVNRLDRERASLERTLQSIHGALEPHGRPGAAADRRGKSVSRRRRSRGAEGVRLPAGRQRQVHRVADPAGNGGRGRGGARSADRNGRRSRRIADGEVLRGRHADAGAARRGAAKRDGGRASSFRCSAHRRAAEHRRPAAARRHRRLRAVARRAAGRRCVNPKTGEEVERPFSENGPASAFVWKTIADPFAGRITMFRVMSGVLKADSTVHNKTRDTPERLGHVVLLQGKAQTNVPELHAGDLGAVPKLKDTLTNDTLGDKADPAVFPGDEISGAGAVVRHRAEEPRRRRQDQHVDAPAGGRGSVDQLQPRSADEGAAALGAGPAAHRSDGGEAEAALRRRRQPEAAAHSVSRDDQGRDRGARPAQEADRRPRPVRRLQDQSGAAAARRRLRVRGRHIRRLDSAAVHSGRGKGHPGSPRARVSRRLSRWWISA